MDSMPNHSRENQEKIKELFTPMLSQRPGRKFFDWQTSIPHLDTFIGKSPQMMRIYQDIRKVAKFDSTVCISGESGTGKELVAKALHKLSPRHCYPLIDLNCAAIPQNLAECELFGYEKGAYTGAIQSKPGKFELAHRGTLFLDEIGELSLNIQAKLLRALQEKKIYRVGGQKPIDVDVRIVVSTNKDLAEEVKKGNFRADLFFRLDVFPIVLPPLRQRLEDIPLLASHFLDRFVPSNSGFHPKVIPCLQNHSWPGNVRELIHTIERAVVHHEGNGPLTLKTFFPSVNFLPKSCDLAPVSQYKGTLKDQIERFEKKIIKEILNHNCWHKKKTAEALEITRKTLDAKIEKYQLKNKSKGSSPSF